MSDDRLSWREFEELIDNCKAEAQNTLGEEEIPWPPEDTITRFVTYISKLRKEASSAWIDSLETETHNVESMSAVDVNRLHTRASNPPANLTEMHSRRLDKVVNKIEIQINDLKIEWLVEKFKELPPAVRRRFLSIVSEMADD